MELQHDPRTKQQIKDLLYELLYVPVKNKYHAKLQAIIKRNCVLLSTSYESFNFRGTLYMADGTTQLPRKANRLAPALRAEMEAYLHDLKELNEHELPYVLGFLNQVLNSSNDLPDYLRLLPESLHQPIEALIASCGCRATHLSAEDVQEIKQRNQVSIELIRRRQVLNLIE